MEDTVLENRLTTLESAQQYMAEQIIEITATQKEIRDLTMSVNSLAISVKNLCTDVTKVTGRVDLIESKPGKRWEESVGYVINLLIGSALGYLVGKAIGF